MEGCYPERQRLQSQRRNLAIICKSCKFGLMRNAKYSGVYSGKSLTRSPDGKSLKRFYFVWDLGNSCYAAQALDNSFTPVEKPRLLSAAQLKASLKLEPGILATPLSTPDFRSAGSDTRNRSEATELTDASIHELEKARKAKQVETDMRNNFDKAIRALSRPRDRKGALAALNQLAETTEGIVPAHKHMFRDFGVSLRKKSLPELALTCAKRTLELAPNDDHAHFNMARLLGILGLYDEAEAHMQKAMKLDRTEKIYPRMLEWLRNERDQ